MLKILTAAVASLVLSFSAFAAGDEWTAEKCKEEMQKCSAGDAKCMENVKNHKGCEKVSM